MPLREDSHRRRAIAASAAALGAVVLVAGVVWHILDLRSQTLATAQRTTSMRAAAGARMIDVWVAQRMGDADELSGIARIHGTDSLGLSPRALDRLLDNEIESVQRREHYPAIWMATDRAKPIMSRGGQVMTAAESSTVIRAIEAGTTVFSRPERHDSTVTVTLARPIFISQRGVRKAEAAVVLRSNLSRAFTQNVVSTTRTTIAAAPVIVVPAEHGLVGITLCPVRTYTVCVLAATDTMARIAQGAPEFRGAITTHDGRKLLVATRHAREVPWSVYYAIDESAAFAPAGARLRFEGLLLLGVILVGGLAIYAYDRSVHLRRVVERAQNEARFATIVNTAMDAIVIVDDTYRITVLNDAAQAMFGYTAEDGLGRPALDLIPDASKDEMLRTLGQALHAGEKPRVFGADRYAAGRRRDGSTFPIDLSVSRTQIDGRAHLTIVMRDITDWKRAEESSEWQRRVLESIATGVDLSEVLGTIARFHETQCQGVDCAIHLIDEDGVTLRSASAPSMRPEFLHAMDEIVIGPHAATCGTAVYRRQQVITSNIAVDRIWNEYRALAVEQGYKACWATPIRSPQGRVLGALALYVREAREPSASELRVTATATQLAGIAVDRAHAAESLRQSEASFRSFVENSPIGIYRATGTGRLLAVNASLVQFLGYTSALELLQIDMGTDLFAVTEDRDRLLTELQTQGELRSTEMDWRRKDGTVVTVRVSARAYRDERGSVWFSEGFVENVTPLRAAEQALRQSEKLAALGQLVSGVAHELNNPLAAILHFAEDLLDDERTAADLEALSVIRDQARRSRSIVRDLLSFVRFRDAARERVPITDALDASLKALQPAVEESGARLVVELPPAEAFGNTDRAGLQQIVTNLVMNAAQASGPGGTVTFKASVSDQELQLVVEDSGPGIPARLMDRIFEPFFTTKPLGQGTGLGLSVTLGIVQQLGGRIAVENCGGVEGNGARFTVGLPVLGAVADPGPGVPRSVLGATATSATRAEHQPRVLIIDDEPSIRAALRRFFTRRGWQVEEAEDGAQGLVTMLSGKSEFAVIISDLKMPGCSGMELHDHIATVAPAMLDRIIFSTGDVASKDAAEFVRRTRCVVMQKPFELRSLESVVTRIRDLATA